MFYVNEQLEHLMFEVRLVMLCSFAGVVCLLKYIEAKMSYVHIFDC